MLEQAQRLQFEQKATRFQVRNLPAVLGMAQGDCAKYMFQGLAGSAALPGSHLHVS